EPGARDRRVFQPAARGRLQRPGRGHGARRVALGARGPGAERDPADASGAWVRVDRFDLAGVLDALAHAVDSWLALLALAAVPVADRGPRSARGRTDGTSRWISEWCERAGIAAPL